MLSLFSFSKIRISPGKQCNKNEGPGVNTHLEVPASANTYRNKVLFSVIMQTSPEEIQKMLRRKCKTDKMLSGKPT